MPRPSQEAGRRGQDWCRGLEMLLHVAAETGPGAKPLDAEAHQEVEKLEVNLKNARDDLDRTWMFFQTPMPPFFL